MKRIGIIGGTFNPLHNGHLFIAEEIRFAFNLSKVIFVPNKIPPHKNEIIENTDHRWNMLNLGISSNQFFESSRIELDRTRISYSVDTIRYFYNIYQNNPLFFITGLDALLNYSWHNFEEIIELVENFIAVSRPGYSGKRFQDKIKKLYPLCLNKIIQFDILLLEISSTNIRERLYKGKSIKYLVPESIEKYILDNRLYLDKR